MIEIYRDTYKIEKTPGNLLYQIIQRIDQEVVDCANRAYNINSLDIYAPKQNLWKQEAEYYLQQGKHSFTIYTSYGSAVEEMVSQFIRANYQVPVNGYIVLLQVRHGHTIPDIVITDLNGTELVWLDITSGGAAGHIWDKEGSGWDTTAFVAELLYDSLDFNKIRYSDVPGIGFRARALSLSRKASIYQQHLKDHLSDKLIDVMIVIDYRGSVTKSEIADIMESEFKTSFSAVKHPAIKSLFKKFIEYFPYSQYCDMAKTILNMYYKIDRQDFALAMRFLSASYNIKQQEDDSDFLA